MSDTRRTAKRPTEIFPEVGGGCKTQPTTAEGTVEAFQEGPGRLDKRGKSYEASRSSWRWAKRWSEEM